MKKRKAGITGQVLYLGDKGMYWDEPYDEMRRLQEDMLITNIRKATTPGNDVLLEVLTELNNSLPNK